MSSPNFDLSVFDKTNAFTNAVYGVEAFPYGQAIIYKEVFSAIFAVDGGRGYFLTRDPTKPFAFNEDPVYLEIKAKYSKYDSYGNHSGASYACMMRDVQDIIRGGLEPWIVAVVKRTAEKAKSAADDVLHIPRRTAANAKTTRSF